MYTCTGEYLVNGAGESSLGYIARRCLKYKQIKDKKRKVAKVRLK